MKKKHLAIVLGIVLMASLNMNVVYGEETVNENVDLEIKEVVEKSSYNQLNNNNDYKINSIMKDRIYASSAYEAASELKIRQNEIDNIHREWIEMNGEGLIAIDNPDEEYDGAIIELDQENRALLERIVMGEAGGEGVEGAALVAQCIHDTMIKDNNYDVASIISSYKYSGSLDKEPNNNAKEAVSIVFDQGGYAVKHRIIYFYAPGLVDSTWHESQNFVVEYGGHRVFDRRG